MCEVRTPLIFNLPSSPSLPHTRNSLPSLQQHPIGLFQFLNAEVEVRVKINQALSPFPPPTQMARMSYYSPESKHPGSHSGLWLSLPGPTGYWILSPMLLSLFWSLISIVWLRWIQYKILQKFESHEVIWQVSVCARVVIIAFERRLAVEKKAVVNSRVVPADFTCCPPLLKQFSLDSTYKVLEVSFGEEVQLRIIEIHMVQGSSLPRI